jgi:hypothetical protein
MLSQYIETAAPFIVFGTWIIWFIFILAFLDLMYSKQRKTGRSELDAGWMEDLSLDNSSHVIVRYYPSKES